MSKASKDSSGQIMSAAGGPPFKLQKVWDFGTNEPWVARIQVGIPDVAKFAIPDQKERDAFLEAWHHLSMKLGEGFGALLELRRLNEEPDSSLGDLSRSYTSLYSSVWAAYKDRWQSAMKLIGFDMGFLFVADANFDAAFNRFVADHPFDEPDQLKTAFVADRASWQTRLGSYRNQEIEHRAGTEDVEFFQNQTSAEASFYNVWRAIEDWTIMALGTFVKHPMMIFLIPKDERDAQIPKKYQVGIDASVLPPLPSSDVAS